MRHKIWIEIAGIHNTTEPDAPIRWHVDDDPLRFDDGASDHWSLVDRYGSIVDLGAFSAAIEEGQAVAQSAVTTFSIVADDKRSGIGNRPIDYFGRIGAEQLAASDVWATPGLTAGATTLTVAAGVAQASPATRLLHVGTECVYVNDAEIPASGTINITRGRIRTLARPHRATGSGFLARTIPVTKYPTQWIGRRVLVFVDNKIWRDGFLVENPRISGNVIVFSFVSNENLLSVKRSGDYVPTYGTTLVPSSNSGWNNQYFYFRFFWSLPQRELILSPTSTQYVSKQDLIDNYDINVTSSGDDPAAMKLYCLWWHWDGEPLGVYYFPAASAIVQAPNEAATAYVAPQFEIPLTENGYFAWVEGEEVPTTVGITHIFDTSSSGYQAMVSTPTSSPNWQVVGYRSPAMSAMSGLRLRLVEGASDGYNRSTFTAAYGDYDQVDPASILMSGGALKFRNACSKKYRYPFTHDIEVGFVSRRNVRDDETIATDVANGNLFSGWPRMQIQGAQMESQFRPFSPAGISKSLTTYGIRPTAEGTLHHQLVEDGCVMSFDAWTIPATVDKFAVGVDLASAFWERGQNAIQTLAEIPGVGNTDTAVSIVWEEPDGAVFNASAEVRRWTAYDATGVYGYHITNVKLDNGKPCVGFGSWPTKTPVQISRPIRASGRLGSIVPQIVASDDGTSGRVFDSLGDGLGCPLTSKGALSLSTLGGSALPPYWQFSPRAVSYDDFLRMASLASGMMIVGQINNVVGSLGNEDYDIIQYGPEARPSGRPAANESVATWADDDFVGLPESSGESGLVYTSYRVTHGDTINISAVDWLAADMLGQGEACDLDLTRVYSRPRMLTTETVATMIDALRDRYGTQRRRWSVTVPIDIALRRCVGDVITITSKYLIGAAGTGPGVTNALARIVSISHDFKSGIASVELLAWASYGNGYNVSLSGVIQTVSGTSYVLRFPFAGDSPADSARRKADAISFRPRGYDTSSLYVVYTVEGAASGAMTGHFVSGSRFEGVNYVEWSFSRVSAIATPYSTTGTKIMVEPIFSQSAGDLFRFNADIFL